MTLLFSIEEFDYRFLSPEYENIAVSLVADCFAAYEPMSRYCGISSRMQAESCMNVLDNYLGREVSVMCIHRPSQELCGAFICHGYNPDGSEVPFIPTDSNPINEKNSFLTMLKLYDELDYKLFDILKIERRLCLHQVLQGVDKRWKKRRIGYYLVLASIEAGKSKGLTYAMAEATGPIPQKIFIDQLGYTCSAEYIYKEYEVNGIKVFKDLEGSCKLVFKHISSNNQKI